MVQISNIDAILHASPVVQLTLLVLLILSVFCWATGFYKMKQFKQLESANRDFLEAYEKESALDLLFAKIKKHSQSSIARIFSSAYIELDQIMKTHSIPSAQTSPMKYHGMDSLERIVQKSIDIEVSILENRMTLLATTGSTGPFIGLFGTVWGIMGSFHKIGQMGSASLAVVAPGISEALIATAIGLGAAIPAVVMYNHFLSKIKKHEMEMNNFSTELLNLIRKHLIKE